MTEKKKPNPKAAIKFCEKIAKIALGSAPSAGYMQELILEAREAVGITTDKEEL